MRLHRFYIGKDFILGSGEVSKFSSANKDIIHQLRHVFKYKNGQKVILFDGLGEEYIAEISDIDKKEINFSLIEKAKSLIQEKLALCFSLLKKDNIELVLQKCTELGVTNFYPLISERSEKKAFNKERAEKIIMEATEQAGWSVLPKIHETAHLRSVIEKTKNYKQIVFHTDHENGSQKVKTSDRVALFTGPEGGWSEREVELFKKENIEFFSLGPQTLRAETAAIVAVGRFT